MTFFGERRWDEDVHPHESPKVMTLPLIILAIGSVAMGGFLIVGSFSDFLSPVVGAPTVKSFQPVGAWGVVTFVLMLLGAGVAWAQYGRRAVPREAPRATALVAFARHDLYGDALNESLLMRPGQWLTRLTVYFDNRGVDGLVNGMAALIGGTSGRLRRVQTGFVRSYALAMFLGAAVVVGALLLVRL
jgi:NADH-quinone oxidoreductase subunit L